MDNATPPFNSAAALTTERLLAATPQEIFAAFEQPELLARWWGPDGFTNTFEQFEFKPGGKWVFVMHGPDGANYANTSVFREVERDRKIVIEHIVAPWFALTVTLNHEEGLTRLKWVQQFESPEVAAKLQSVCGPANEQNLNRLEAVLKASQ